VRPSVTVGMYTTNGLFHNRKSSGREFFFRLYSNKTPHKQAHPPFLSILSEKRSSLSVGYSTIPLLLIEILMVPVSNHAMRGVQGIHTLIDTPIPHFTGRTGVVELESTKIFQEFFYVLRIHISITLKVAITLIVINTWIIKQKSAKVC